jgi:predicted lipoprotein with Yx(FWY)xxD motif
MRHPKILIAGISIAAVAAAGGVTAATIGGGSPAASPRPTSSSAPAAPAGGAATVHTASASVTGKTETILINSQGLPLYYYPPDTAAKSLVAGGLARLWPPVTLAAPTTAGVSGKLTVVNDAHGHQVAYNGHLLYTFTGDRAGQGFQNFFVATPGLAPVAGSPAPATPAPNAPPVGGNGY